MTILLKIISTKTNFWRKFVIGKISIPNLIMQWKLRCQFLSNTQKQSILVRARFSKVELKRHLNMYLNT